MIRTVLLLLTAAFAAAAVPLTDGFVFVAGGSGVVIDPSGLVVTCHHVTASVCAPHRPALEVRLGDGTVLPARLVACDPVGDIALLQIHGEHPPLGARRWAEPPPPGSAVWAVGNPFALGDLDDRPSVSTGVLSTGLVVRADYLAALVHDAPVNPGNSGGPLYDAAGGLLGINGAIRSRTGYRINSGIGIAIAAEQIRRFLPALRDSPTGYVHRCAPPPGLELRDTEEGPTVAAAAGGLTVGDRVTAVAGRPVIQARTALALFGAVPWRPEQTVLVVTARGPVTVPAVRRPIPGTAWLGLTFADRPGRVEIAATEEGSPAASKEIPAGAQVLSVDAEPVTTRLEVLRHLDGKEPGDTVALTWRPVEGADRAATVVLGSGP